MDTFWVQGRVWRWLVKTFGPDVAHDVQLRNLRFIEEAIELVQARRLPKEKLIEVVEQVYAREPGNQEYEVAGTMTTLMALCAQAGINIAEVTYREIERIEQPDIIEKILARQADKVMP